METAHQISGSVRSSSLGRRGGWFWVLTVVVSGSLAGSINSGCRRGEVSVTEMVEVAAKLDKTKQSPNTSLQDELRRLSADRALPDQIDGARATGANHPDSLAARIHELLDEAQTERILKRLPEFFPQGRPSLQAVTIESAAGFLQFYQRPHAAAREALEGAQGRFEWLAVEGWFADTRFTDRVTALCGLELIAGLDAITRDDLPQCLAALSYAGRMIRLLAEDGHLLARLAAVDLREKWLHLAALMVQHPAVQRSHLQQGYELLMRQMAQWPTESQAWITDRAVGLQTYELVRQGHYLSLLSKPEVDALEAEGMHLIRSRAVQRYVDDDQVFYLDIMRRLIDLQRFPYFERSKVLDSIDAQLAEADQLEPYPQIAAEMLLPDVLPAMRKIADDRARSEAWALGLAAALGLPLPSYDRNPTTGDRYELRTEEAQIRVEGLAPEQWPSPLVFPRPAGQE